MKKLFQKLSLLSLLSFGLTLMLAISDVQAASPPEKIYSDAAQLYKEVVVGGVTTKQQFMPRGANYIRLTKNASGWVYHSTFEPGKYNLTAARTFLNQMRSNGYNTVRVFIDPGNTKVSDAHGIGRGMGTNDKIYGPYMDNFASFVNEAAARGIYVLPAMDAFPQNSYYWGLVGANRDSHSYLNVAGRNQSYMERGHIIAKGEYLKEFAKALIERVGPNANAVLAYQSDNELFYEANQAPFHVLSGTVRPVDGLLYDMSKPADRQQAADASMVAYSIAINQKLREADPKALMTTGFFTNRAVQKTVYNGLTTSYCSTNCQPTVDYRVPGRPAALSTWGKVDFLDIHIYPNMATGYNVLFDLNTIEENLFKKPYIIGEFGANKDVYSTVSTAAYAMKDFRAASCREGAQGWLFWTWDTYENLAYQEKFYKMTESGGVINNMLMPGYPSTSCGYRALIAPRTSSTTKSVSSYTR